jgi:F-type H+-transporting ATPase subunit b
VLIDWFTVVAQIVNFLILVALLKYFLYGRVIAAMEKREQEIANQWDEAEQARHDATVETESIRQKNRDLDEQREHLLATVRDEVDAHRKELTTKAREEANDLQSRWAAAIREETESFLRDLNRRASEEVCAIARRALSDLAGEDLQQRIVHVFLKQLRELDGAKRQAVIESLQSANRQVVIRSAFELPIDLQAQVAEALESTFVDGLDIHFEESAELICGIELNTNSHKLAWELSDYLDSLTQQVERMIEEETAGSLPDHGAGSLVSC